MNHSELTRKEQVLAYLQQHANQWVDGPDLATEAVGGSEGLRRLRELRLSGDHDIRERRHPDAHRDIWQYRLVVLDHTIFGPNSKTYHVPLTEGSLDLSDAFDDAKPSYPDPVTELARREEEATPPPLDLPVEAPSPWPADHDQTRISSAVKRKEDGTFEYVPPQRPFVEQTEIPADPPQPVGAKFDRMPTRLVWGDMAICPRCHQKTTRGRKPKPKDETPTSTPEHIRQRRKKAEAKEGPALIDEYGVLLYRDPTSKKPKPCERCNGYGIVPNQGPIPMTAPDA